MFIIPLVHPMQSFTDKNHNEEDKLIIEIVYDNDGGGAKGTNATKLPWVPRPRWSDPIINQFSCVFITTLDQTKIFDKGSFKNNELFGNTSYRGIRV